MDILGLSRHGLTTAFEQWAIVGVLITAFISLLYAWLLHNTVLKHDTGTTKMQEVWNAIRLGADSYLSRQLRTILPAILLLVVALFLSVYVVEPSVEAVEEFGDQARTIMAFGRAIAFVVGATFSMLVGQLGMRMAIQASIRSASAAKRSFNESLSIAYYAGTITGMLTDGLGLLGGTVIFIIFGRAAPDALLGFGFGGTLIALFMRVGGGIYTKAADVGADQLAHDHAERSGDARQPDAVPVSHPAPLCDGDSVRAAAREHAAADLDAVYPIGHAAAF